MPFADKRTEAIALFREHCRLRVSQGVTVREVYLDLTSAMDALVQEFLVEHELENTRYWHLPQGDLYIALAPGENLPPLPEGEPPWLELTRYEFLSRQGIHFGYESDRL